MTSADSDAGSLRRFCLLPKTVANPRIRAPQVISLMAKTKQSHATGQSGRTGSPVCRRVGPAHRGKRSGPLSKHAAETGHALSGVSVRGERRLDHGRMSARNRAIRRSTSPVQHRAVHNPLTLPTRPTRSRTAKMTTEFNFGRALVPAYRSAGGRGRDQAVASDRASASARSPMNPCQFAQRSRRSSLDLLPKI